MNSNISESTVKYAEQFKYWQSTAKTFFDIATKKIDDVIANGTDDLSTVEIIADAWHECMIAQWTLYKSGKQTANRMALRRGIDNRQTHPAQYKKKKNVEAEVNAALEGGTK